MTILMKLTVMSTENTKTGSLGYKTLTHPLCTIFNAESNLSLRPKVGRMIMQQRLYLEDMHTWIRIGVLAITTSLHSIIIKLKLILHNEKTMVMK